MVSGYDFVVDNNLSAAELNHCDGVITECTLAIAETGTIVPPDHSRPGAPRHHASFLTTISASST